MGYLNIKTFNTFEILLNDICGGQWMGPHFIIYHFLSNLHVNFVVFIMHINWVIGNVWRIGAYVLSNQY
jgi:hypothetical protein